MKRFLSQQGQSTIEAALTLPLLIVVITAFTLLLYRGMVFYFADYNLHEALICAESSPLISCERELKNRLANVLITNVHYEVHLRKSGRSFQGTLSVDFNPPLKLEQTLKKASLW
ncbi:TadE/TadG family type IV pilus assembly protein [Bdellovibrio bacteriovorus]|uniref:TadE/TadG family type IV pilus assembly protein n=1 Tax=Bdellovibrio TaxID=958 RepID=UPI0035A91CCF